MPGVPNVFANASGSIPLSQLDANFNTTLTIGSTSVGLGNTISTISNVAISTGSVNGSPVGNVTPSSGAFTTLSATGNVTIADGTVSVPAIAFTSDTDSGIYRIGANNIGVGVNGAKVLDIATTGLSVTGAIDTTSNLLVGTTNSSSTVGVGFKALPNATYPQLAMVGSATTNSATTLEIYSTGASAYRFYVGYGGTIFATSTTISAISDARYKENIVDLDVGLDAIMSLKPRKFDWKDGKGKNIKGDRGFIAQEFEQVFPDLIDEWKDNVADGEEPYKSVRQDLIPILVKAIQELSQRLSMLENK